MSTHIWIVDRHVCDVICIVDVYTCLYIYTRARQTHRLPHRGGIFSLIGLTKKAQKGYFE